MNKTALIEALRAHLADKEDIANEAAPALALMRYSLVELLKPTSSQGNDDGAAELRKELASADSVITRLTDELTDRDGYLYVLLAELGMVPEVDDEPVDSVREAIEHQADILDALQDRISILNAAQEETTADDKDRFISAVRELLEASPEMGLQDLWNELEGKAQYLTGLETGIEQRDSLLLQADQRSMAIRAKLGIPDGADGSVEQLELANIDLLIKQRQAAQDRLSGNQQNQLLANIADAARMPAHRPMHSLADFVRQIVQERDEAGKAWAAKLTEKPAEGTLEAIIEQILEVTHTDWQDVEQLPQEIQKLRDNLDQVLLTPAAAPKPGWVVDAIDLAHAVRGNLAPENRVMAKAAEAIILRAPGVSDG